MKRGWEIRKLGDLTTALNGLWVGKKPPFVNIAVIRNTNFTKDCKLDTTDIAYIDAEVKHFSTRKLQCGDIIIEKSGGSDKQPVGRPVLFNIPEGDFSFSNFTSTLRINDQSEMLPSFLHKVLCAIYRSGKTASLQSKTTGIRNLDFKSYLKLSIPVPPITEQEKIVAELDCLTGIIEKKKRQLEELDNLAQSIFYDMFGDPITNEKKWELQPFGKVYRLKSGDGLKEKDFAGGDYPVYGGNGISGYHNLFNKSGKHIIIGRVGAYCGNVRFVQGDFWLTDNAFDASFDDTITDYLYACFLLNTLNLHQYANHAAQPVISNAGLKEVPIIIPPIDLQNAFAQKIEAIEKQKELIKKSIQETETLFNSRMDYWFN